MAANNIPKPSIDLPSIFGNPKGQRLDIDIQLSAYVHGHHSRLSEGDSGTPSQ